MRARVIFPDGSQKLITAGGIEKLYDEAVRWIEAFPGARVEVEDDEEEDIVGG